MLSQLLQPEIKSLIDERKLSTLKEVLSDWSPADIAELIAELSENEQAVVFRVLPQELAADTFEYLEFDMQVTLLKAMGKEEVASILNEMSPDDRTALLEDLPSSAARQMMMLLSTEERHIARTLLGYPEDSVGRLMTPDYLAVKPESTIEEVLNYIRKNGRDKETINTLYIVNEKGKLMDDVRIREILLAEFNQQILDLMDENYIALNVYDDQETAVEIFKKYDRIALPVVDSFGVLLGIVTVDDVFDVAEEEATEDIHKIAGVTALEEAYSSISLFEMIKKRGGWLALLFVGEMFTATAMGLFEVEIKKAIVLTLFLPLIISSGGNSGSQASTLVIRALSLGEISLKDWLFRNEKRNYNRICTGRNTCGDRISENFCMAGSFRRLWYTLADGRDNSVNSFNRSSTLGYSVGIYAALYTKKTGCGSGNFQCSSCSYYGGCDWTNNLLPGRYFYTERDSALK